MTVQNLCAGFDVFVLSMTIMRVDNKDHMPWIIHVYSEEKIDCDGLGRSMLDMAAAYSLPHAVVEAVQNQLWQSEELDDSINWLEHSYAMNPPLDVPPFFIYGSHYTGEKPGDALCLNIDAVTAFGSGDHGTTKGCLSLMAHLKGMGVCPWNTLDMGTGSGILAIGAYKLWKAPVVAVDNDAESINVTRRHMQMNGVPESAADIACLVNEGFDGHAVQDKGPYELVIANILAGPLRDMARALCETVDDNGYVILSGILNEQAEGVIAAYTAQGLCLCEHRVIGEWSTLLFQKR
jgi:ribosomal protein L11 methyltransferase